jgi:hypothetical protein
MPPRPLLPLGYRPRNPEETVLHQTLSDELETFLAEAEAKSPHSRGVPSFVRRELERFLTCGVLSNGFMRVWCPNCNDDLLVPFSCRGRGFCPSCLGRRMTDCAAHLVDRVIPLQPVRQWVLSLAFPLRYLVGYDADLLTDVLSIFVASVSRLYQSAAEKRGITDPRTGGITAVQRGDSALRLNPHFHTLFLDGVFSRGEAGGRPRFHPHLDLSDADVTHVVEDVRDSVLSLLRRRGQLPDEDGLLDEPDRLATGDPWLSACYEQSIRGTGTRTGTTGSERGKRAIRKGVVKGLVGPPTLGGTLCAQAGGFDLHANVRIRRGQRGALERLAQYILRPPLSNDRLSRLDDGSLRYQLKRRWKDGTDAIFMTASQLLEKLAALVPSPRTHQIRYHGVLAPNSGLRREIAPTPPARPSQCSKPPDPPASSPDDGPSEPCALRPDAGSPGWIRRARSPWAILLARAFNIDILTCVRCGARRRILAFIRHGATAQKILRHLGLHPDPPRIAPAREPPLAEPAW